MNINLLKIKIFLALFTNSIKKRVSAKPPYFIAKNRQYFFLHTTKYYINMNKVLSYKNSY